MASVFFNLLLLCADFFGLWWLKRNPTVRSLVGLAFVWTGVLVFLSFALGLQIFLIMRLMCYGLFLHLPIVLLIASRVLWPTRRIASGGLAAIAVVNCVVAIDAFFIEPEWLQVTEQTIVSEQISKPLRVVVVADLQTDYFGDYHRDVFRRCLAAKPDLILLAGDYAQVHDGKEWPVVRDQLRDHLQEIQFSAPLGIYAVCGNTDHPQWQTLFEGSRVTCLPETETVDLGEVSLTGLGIWDSFSANLALPRPQPGKFHLVLGHAPDFARSREVNGDFLIAGHTHGGQVRLPGIGPLMTASSVPRKWAIGLTRLDESRQLFVSRGIGMERGYAPRLRFLCRPELAIIDFVPADQ